MLALAPPAIVQAQLGPPAGSLQSTGEDHLRPAWVALPDAGSVDVPDDVVVEPVNTLVLTRKAPREAVLVGALRNRGRALSGVRVRLTLLDGDGRPIGDATHSQTPWVDVRPGELLPFRVPLVARETLAEMPAAYRLSLEASKEPASTRVAVDRLALRRRAGRGGTVAGRLVDVREGIASETQGLMVVLMDASGAVLDVVVGAWRVEAASRGGAAAFSLRTDWPLPRDVAAAEAWLAVAVPMRRATPTGPAS